MSIDFLLTRFQEHAEKDAIIWKDDVYSYRWLSETITALQQETLPTHDIQPGQIVAIDTDFSPTAVALLLTLIHHGCIIVPLSVDVKTKEEFCEIAQVQHLFQLRSEQLTYKKIGHESTHSFFTTLQEAKHPGLVLFSSGSTGKSKGAVHDLLPLLEKFKVTRPAMRTMTFLLFDHIGGVNTLLYILSNAGTMIAVNQRDPASICRQIEAHKVELLPTTPTFLNMLLFSRAFEQHDMSSLKMITYGTEVMPEHVLTSLRQHFPDVRLKQTYGLSELGILRSKSRDSHSLWVKVGGEDYQTRIVDDILHIKAKSAMLGYLNAPSPFDEEGWFNTQDRVVQDGEWLQILGRDSDIINVGGQKVYPAEVESVIMGIDNIIEASVTRVENPIMGHVVGVRLRLREEEPISAVKRRIRKHCKQHLESYKIPVHVELATEALVSERFKRIR